MFPEFAGNFYPTWYMAGHCQSGGILVLNEFIKHKSDEY